ncbi:MAG: FAD-binding domain-containing protein [Wenzhouxiangella sp.]|nr:FAD-binding domain-containing protein [Wenzhouxiangella sp.]
MPATFRLAEEVARLLARGALLLRALPAQPRQAAIVSLQLVWFKRDLRIDDHRPLVEAVKRGPVLPVYVVEPGFWRGRDTSRRQQDFIADSLADLHVALEHLGQGLLLEHGDMIDVLQRLHQRWRFGAIHAHEETGNDWTFQRDRVVRAWCQQVDVALHEYPQFGVLRGLRRRDGWARQWEACMAEPPVSPPNALPGVTATRLSRKPFAAAPASGQLDCPGRQRGGLKAGAEVLASFLDQRAEAYRGGISSPLSAQTAGSRLSPHIAYGTLSLRRLVQRTRDKAAEARASGAKRLAGSLNHFDKRLHWHCHFIQKLEQQPDIEFANVHRGFDGMREDRFDAERFQAWAEGRTGYPLVDACMRFLIQHGWLNFRMRAMLMSFAAYQLWLHWREPALHLARLFTDYEPGIHYNQCQMQSGTTGINTLRIYNPVKQAHDQDPEALFVRRWLPELVHVPPDRCFEPWKLGLVERQRYGAEDYPEPVVDHQRAARQARALIGEYRRQEGFHDEAKAIQESLGSRKSVPRRRRAQTSARQPSLF